MREDISDKVRQLQSEVRMMKAVQPWDRRMLRRTISRVRVGFRPERGAHHVVDWMEVFLRFRVVRSDREGLGAPFLQVGTWATCGGTPVMRFMPEVSHPFLACDACIVGQDEVTVHLCGAEFENARYVVRVMVIGSAGVEFTSGEYVCHFFSDTTGAKGTERGAVELVAD